jgi:hypothetical protein
MLWGYIRPTLTKRNTSDDCSCISYIVAALDTSAHLSDSRFTCIKLVIHPKNYGDRVSIPSNTSLNCANLEPPGRCPCCALAAMLGYIGASLVGRQYDS